MFIPMCIAKKHWKSLNFHCFFTIVLIFAAFNINPDLASILVPTWLHFRVICMSWGSLGRSWAVLGASCGPLGNVLARLGGILGVFVLAETH